MALPSPPFLREALLLVGMFFFLLFKLRSHAHFARSTDSELAAAPSKPHFRAVLVVLASSNGPFYTFCRSAWLALAETALQDGVRVVLLYGLGSLSAEEETSFDLVVNFTDALDEWVGGSAPVLVNKTLMALPILLERFSFDFIVRTNIHTFWDARRLAGRLASLPSSGCLAGHKMGWVQGLSFVNGIDFIISSDLVQPMVEAGRDTAAYSAFAEDIAMSVIVHGILKVPILDAWYGEPGGKGPLLFFLSNGLTKEAVCA